VGAVANIARTPDSVVFVDSKKRIGSAFYLQLSSQSERPWRSDKLPLFSSHCNRNHNHRRRRRRRRAVRFVAGGGPRIARYDS
jgi:hypothetical protein